MKPHIPANMFEARACIGALTEFVGEVEEYLQRIPTEARKQDDDDLIQMIIWLEDRGIIEKDGD